MILIIVCLALPNPLLYSADVPPGGPLREELLSFGNSISLSFSIPDDLQIQSAPDGDRISLNGFLPGVQPGDPELPMYEFCFLMPGDIDPETIQATLENPEWEDIPGTFDIVPVSPDAFVTEEKPVFLWGEKDPRFIVNGKDIGIYRTDRYFPENPLDRPFTSIFRRWNLAYIALRPVRCNPVQGKISLLRFGIIQINFERLKNTKASDARQYITPENQEKFFRKIASRIENPDNRDLFYTPVSNTRDDKIQAVTADFIVITTSNIQSGSAWLSTFEAHKEISPYNFNVSIIIEHSTTADDTHYLSGSSCSARAENIREWLKDNQSTIEYVLLIGDPDPSTFTSNRSIPMLNCFPYYDTHATTGTIPTDMSYAELSGDWDKDGDGYPGEYRSYNREDFQTGGIDKNCEVGVGRIPYYGNMTDLDNILKKIINYEEATGSEDWREKILIPAAVLNHSPQDANLDGDANDTEVDREYSLASERTLGAVWGEAMKTLATGAGYSAYTLYEKEGINEDIGYPKQSCSSPLTKANVKSEWLNKYGFVSWLGHGSETGVTRVIWDNDDWKLDDNYTAPDNITQYPDELRYEKFWESSDCSSLNDEYPSIVFEGSCNNATPENSGNLAYSLLKNGAIGAFACTRVSKYSPGPYSLSSYAYLRSYGYKLYERMITQRETASDAMNSCRSYFSLSSSSWWNMVVLNLYGPPALTQIVLNNYPDEPSNPGATNITTSKIRWTWQDNSTNEDGFHVFARIGTTPPSSASHTIAKDTNYCDHTSLATNTRYSMQVSAYNTYYESLKTSPISRYTAIDPISGLNFSNITQDSITVASSNIPTNITCSSSGIRISNVTASTDSGWKQDNLPWVSDSLSVNTPYTFQGDARNGDGTVASPFAASKYTAIEPIDGLSLSNVQIDKITVQSTNTPSNLASGSSALIFVISPGNSPCPWRQNNTTYQFQNLSPNTQYSFYGQSRNGDMLVATASNIQTKYTLANTPTAPTITNPGLNTLDVAIGPADSNPSSTDYAIEIFPTVGGCSWVQANGSIGATAVYQAGSTWGTKTVTGLSIATTYSFRSTAKNGEGILAGPGPWGISTTLDNPPNAPTNPGTSWIGHYGITWTWQDNSTNENGFKIYAGQGATAPSIMCYQAPVNATAWSQICSINTQYAFQVSAFNSGGESAKTSNLARYTLIENVLGLNFSNITNLSIDVSATNTPSNLSSGSSGLYFANTTMATNSGWKQNNNAWSSTGLSPNVQYSFTGQSRNGDGTVAPAYPDKKYTLCNVPTMPVVSRPTASTLDVAIGPGDGNPAYTPYCIEIVQTPPGLSGYVQMNGTVGATPVYMIASAWGTKCVGPLPSSSTFLIYTFAINGEGILAGPSPVATGATNASGASPSAPANPGATNIANDSIRWTWADTSSNEIGFTVFTCTGAGEPSDLNLKPQDTELLDQGGLSPNTAYSMQVAAYNNEGPSAKTITITKYTLANTPAAPSVTSPTENTLDVSIGSGDGNTTWTLYAIQISPSVGGNTWIQSDGSVGASAVYQTAAAWGVVTVQGLSSSTIYTFTVIARNGDNTDTAAGPGGSGTTLAPGSLPTAAPTGPGAADISTSGIRWTWNDNSSNETGFKVYAGAGSSAPGTVTHTASANALWWDHPGLIPNIQYAMQVSAANTNGDSAKTTDIARYTAIEQVSGLTFSGVTSTGIGVSSANTPSNLGAGSSGLQFTITSPFTLATPWRQNNTPYSFNGLSPNTVYTFSGQSRNGDGLASAAFSGAVKYTLANTPAAPILSNPSTNGIVVAIGPYDGNSPATVYAIQVSPSVGGNSWVQSDGAPGAFPAYQTASAWGTKTVTGLALYTSYTFAVTAQNGEAVSAGPGTGAALSTHPNPPVAPGSTSATGITSSSIVWNWTDNSDNETGFKVYAGSGLSAPSSVTFTTGVNAVFWIQESLSPNAPYAMQAAATNTGGDSSKTATLTKYTLAGAPSPPIVSSVTIDAADFEIDSSDGNPLNTTYSVSLEPDVYENCWIQSDGTVGSSPCCQTAAAWGVKTITGLHPARSYTLRAISRNQDGADNPGMVTVFHTEDLTRVNNTWNLYK